MTSNRKRILTLTLSAVGAVVAIVLVGNSLQRSLFYPLPRNLPSVVSETTDELLEHLQSILEVKAPIVARALKPGLSNAQITDLEIEGGFRLSDDLRAFYRWHNGIAAENAVSLLPGYRFVPLEDLVKERKVVASQVDGATSAQRAVFAVYAGHRKNWAHVLDDGAGDGYFFDPDRTDAEGAFFYHFSETGQYRWFPSFRNFLFGVIECYETGSIKPGPDGKTFDEDYERTDRIWGDLAELNE